MIILLIFIHFWQGGGRVFAHELIYNIDFEVCTLVMLLLVLANIPLHNTVRTFSNRIFILFLVCGLFDVVFDIVSAITMSMPEVYSKGTLWFMLQCYFILQVSMPFLLYLYTRSLHGALSRKNKLPTLFSVLGYGIMLGIVVTNPFLHGLSYFDEVGGYHYGPLRYSTYIYAVLFVVAALIDTVRYRARIARRNIVAIWQFAIINVVMLVIQMIFPHLLLTGVGIAASLIILVITANNPLSKIDTLTGLFDAAALREVLRDTYRRGAPVYPIVVALDNLKRINLVFGYEAGNQLLRECAARLTALAGNEDTFRLLGDTFVLLLHTPRDYDAALEGTQEMFRSPWIVEQTPVHLSAAVCGLPDCTRFTDASELLDYTDYLLGQAKARGAATLLQDDEALRLQYTRSKHIEAYLYTAVRNNLFEVYLQPVYSLAEDRFVSAEALVRLHHPDFGMLSPAEFIPIAERGGEITQVERAIFGKLCRFLQEHPQVGQTLESVKFNLSPASFLSAAPGSYLLHEIDRCGLDPHLFQFEITETTATIYDADLLRWTAGLKEAGAGLCLDDFGSGYANLSAVMKLPFDVVKIDRSLLVDAMTHRQTAILYGKLVDALSGLGFCVLAEGAETEEEVAFLKLVGVQHIQGFYYAHPLPPDEFLQFLGMA